MRLDKISGCVIFCLAAIFVFAFVQCACSGEEKSSATLLNAGSPDKKSIDQNTGQADKHQIVVYYFHGKFRCHTCRRIEQLTKEAVFEFFADEINTGLIDLKVVNVDEGENKHFSKDYQLFTRSVVVSDMIGGKEKQWKNLQKIWELVHNEKAFKEYIRNEIKAYLS